MESLETSIQMYGESELWKANFERLSGKGKVLFLVSSLKLSSTGVPWLPNGEDPRLSLLVQELRFCKLCCMAKNRPKKLGSTSNTNMFSAV